MLVWCQVKLIDLVLELHKLKAPEELLAVLLPRINYRLDASSTYALPARSLRSRTEPALIDSSRTAAAQPACACEVAGVLQRGQLGG
jgi:hypothetical protein